MTSRAQAGFTLLEMLVALVVFGLLMAGIAQAMRYGMVAWTAETRQSAGPATMAAVDGALRRLIEQARPNGFVGQPNQLGFTAPLPAGSPLPGQLADLALVVTPDGRLVMRWTPHPAGVPLRHAPPPETELLLAGVAGLHAQYLAPLPNGSNAWTDTWTQSGLPLLVRIGVTLSGGTVQPGTAWPDLVAAPAAAGTGS
jgi:general secretion pathway protein J